MCCAFSRAGNSPAICHSKTENLKEHTLMADVIIMAIGKPNFLKKDYIKDGAILIDVGINFYNGKMVGDIDFEDIKNKAINYLDNRLKGVYENWINFLESLGNQI